MASKRKHTDRTYEEKYRVIKFCDENPGIRRKDIALKFGIKPQTLSDMMKAETKKKIINAVENPPDARKGTIKRVKKCTFSDIDAALIIWFRQYCTDPDLRIDGDMLVAKANYFCKEFGYESSEITLGWIHRFKKRYGVGKILKSGEAGGVDSEVVKEWKEGKLKEILKLYEPENIFNADETGLFWQLLPEKSLGFIGTKQHGGKKNKTRITALVAANMTGSEKLPLLVVGKSQKPRAFRNVRHIPLTYKANKKAWMTRELFTEWLTKLDRQMKLKRRKIAMVVDNCTAHPSIDLENIELIFLPPNTTSITQPMDGGVIKNLRYFYRKTLASRRLAAAEDKVPFVWNILDAILTLKNAWSLVAQATIENCFRSAGFIAPNIVLDDNINQEETSVPGNSSNVDNSEDTEFRSIWERLETIYPSQLAPLDEFVNLDRDDETHDTAILKDCEIVQLVLRKIDESEQDTEETDEGSDSELSSEKPIPKSSEVMNALDLLNRFTLAKADEQFIEEVSAFTRKYEKFMTKLPLSTSQTTITDFFSKS